MKLKIFVSIATALTSVIMIACAIFPASATSLITFDDLPGAFPYPFIPNGYAGFNWNNFAAANGNTPASYANGPGLVGTGYQNGIVSEQKVAWNNGGTPAYFWSTSAFTLGSIYLTAAWNDGLNVTINGSLGGINGTLMDTETVTVDESGPTFLVFDWQNIDTVYFSSFGGTPVPGLLGSGEQFAMDNITITPLPAALPLFASGLGVLGLLGWRRKRKQVAA